MTGRICVAILGASQNLNRYSNMAQKNLMESGYAVIPISPKYSEVMGIATLNTISDISDPVDTLTIYVGPDKLIQMADEIVQLHPRRVIFNPGTEDSKVESSLQRAGIETEQACTLVLLRTGQFEN